MDEDDLELVVETETQTESRNEIKRKFYRAHKFQAKQWGGKRKITCLNPIAITDDSDNDRDRWIVLYYRRYFVTLDQGTNIISGPHVAKLYYRGDTETVWLGTCQITGNFYDTKRIRKRLRNAIRIKGYFCSKESGEEEFCLSSPSELYVEEVDRTGIIRVNRKGFKTIIIKAPRLKCPICRKNRRSSGALRRHIKIAHQRTLVYMHKAKIIGT